MEVVYGGTVDCGQLDDASTLYTLHATVLCSMLYDRMSDDGLMELRRKSTSMEVWRYGACGGGMEEVFVCCGNWTQSSAQHRPEGCTGHFWTLQVQWVPEGRRKHGSTEHG
mmetsp:Transcript_17707/g.43949  ORF Transcript_17707/g.43949 Transcript_17707/m.43949 type:complete len:111 (-) Transcript_17707:265-597(-)